MSSLKELYYTKIRPELKKSLGLENIYMVPRVEKVVVNVGVGEAVSNRKVLDEVVKQIQLITGQRPVITKARRAEAGFKIRKGFPIGVKATLRGKRMYDFLEKLIKIVIPRVRDFRGINRSNVDQGGNLNLGFAEQLVFPELDFDTIDRLRGLQVVIVVRPQDRDLAIKLYEALGFKFAE